MKAKNLAAEYRQQAEILQEKIEALTPLAFLYKDKDLEVLKRNLKTLQGLRADCLATAELLERV